MTWRRGRKTIGAGGVLAALFVAKAASAAGRQAMRPPPAEATVAVHPWVEVGVGSSFVARGLPFYKTKYDPAFLAGALVTFDHLGPGKLFVGSFHSSAMTRPMRHTLSPEYDPIVGYGLPLATGVSATFGYFAHINPALDQPDAMHELFATLTVDSLPVKVSAEVYVEFLRMYGAYTNINASKKWAWDRVSVEPKLLLGVHGYDKPFGGMLALPLALREVTASVNATWEFAPPFYASVRGALSYTGIPNWFHEDTFLGRMTPFVGTAFGASL